ncbi:hypothetical protein ACFXO9_00825 [Nocardia tengchongensis]|uniref:hypothetical protein n=1 Tax=Nocardia tengchongensis TaxID=2055889 RepID=UPI00369C18A4
MTADNDAGSESTPGHLPPTHHEPHPDANTASPDPASAHPDSDFLRLEPSPPQPDSTTPESGTPRPKPRASQRKRHSMPSGPEPEQSADGSPGEADLTGSAAGAGRQEVATSPREGGTAEGATRSGQHAVDASRLEVTTVRGASETVRHEASNSRVEATTPNSGAGPRESASGWNESSADSRGRDRRETERGRRAGDGNRRPVMPEIAPVAVPSEPAPVEVAGWASWLEEGAVAQAVGERRDSGEVDFWRDAEDLRAEDPMAALVDEARRRAVQTQRRMRIRARVLAIAGVSLALVVLAGIAWLVSSVGDSDGSQAGPASTSAGHAGGAAGTSTANGNQPGMTTWCPAMDTPQRVSGAGAGNLTSGPGIIMRLEYAWYVLRDTAAVRSVLSADAKVAPEQATRDAISATPAGTQHCVTITSADTDRWNVTVDEKHPDGTQTSWQQVITTATRDGRTDITSIVAGSR